MRFKDLLQAYVNKQVDWHLGKANQEEVLKLSKKVFGQMRAMLHGGRQKEVDLGKLIKQYGVLIDKHGLDSEQVRKKKAEINKMLKEIFHGATRSS